MFELLLWRRGCYTKAKIKNKNMSRPKHQLAVIQIRTRSPTSTRIVVVAIDLGPNYYRSQLKPRDLSRHN